MSSIANVGKSFLESQNLQRLTDDWRFLKSSLINNIAKTCLDSQASSAQSDLDEMKQNYIQLLSIFKKMELANQHFNEVKEEGCSSFLTKLLGMSFLDTVTLGAGVGIALSIFYSDQEGKEGGCTQDSTALKIASIALIGVSQVIGKYKDYTSSQNSKKQSEIQGSLLQITDVRVQKDLLIKIRTLIKEGENLVECSRRINSEEFEKKAIDKWNYMKTMLLDDLRDENLELEDKRECSGLHVDEPIDIDFRMSILSLSDDCLKSTVV